MVTSEIVGKKFKIVKTHSFYPRDFTVHDVTDRCVVLKNEVEEYVVTRIGFEANLKGGTFVMEV